MDTTLEDHYLTQIEGLRADVRYWQRAAELNQLTPPGFKFYDHGEYGLLLVTGQANVWRHFQSCRPGQWSVYFHGDICRWTGAYQSINAVVDDFGNLVKVD